jgi:hypothetical protein
MVVHIFHQRAAPFTRTPIPRSPPLLVPIHGFFQRFRVGGCYARSGKLGHVRGPSQEGASSLSGPPSAMVDMVSGAASGAAYRPTDDPLLRSADGSRHRTGPGFRWSTGW